jgi:hypothetical protein
METEGKKASPFGALGVDGGELGELLRGHSLLGLQHLAEDSSGAVLLALGPTPATAHAEAVEGCAVTVLGGARRRGRLRGAIAVGAGDLVHVHEGGEEVVLGADLVEATPAPAAQVVREAECHLRSGTAVVGCARRGRARAARLLRRPAGDGREWAGEVGAPPRRALRRHRHCAPQTQVRARLSQRVSCACLATALHLH